MRDEDWGVQSCHCRLLDWPGGLRKPLHQGSSVKPSPLQDKLVEQCCAEEQFPLDKGVAVRLPQRSDRSYVGRGTQLLIIEQVWGWRKDFKKDEAAKCSCWVSEERAADGSVLNTTVLCLSTSCSPNQFPPRVCEEELNFGSSLFPGSDQTGQQRELEEELRVSGQKAWTWKAKGLKPHMRDPFQPWAWTDPRKVLDAEDHRAPLGQKALVIELASTVHLPVPHSSLLKTTHQSTAFTARDTGVREKIWEL